MEFENIDPYSFKSKRHHYVPIHYLKGFINDDNLFYVYDKVENKIRLVSPKMAFFEWYRNSVELKDGILSSLLEDVLYKKIDTDCAPGLFKLRTYESNDDLINPDNIFALQLFIMSLYWRVPKTDSIYNNLYSRSNITFTNKEGKIVEDKILANEYLKDDNMRKTYRSGMITDTINRLSESKEQDRDQYYKIISFDDDVLITGDFPMVYIFPPTIIEQVIRRTMFIPISAKRLFYSGKEKCPNISIGKILDLNASIINESTRYVCSPNKEYLLDCVEYYLHLKKYDKITYQHFKLFV